MKKKKILFIHHNSSPVGSSTSLLLILKHLDRSKFNPFVLITAPKGKLHYLLIDFNITVEYIKTVTTFGHCNGGRPKLFGYPPFQLITKAVNIPRSIRKIKKYLQKNKFDLVYVNSSVLWPAAKASTSLGIKTILHVREQISNAGFFGIRKAFFRKALEKHNNQMIVLTEASKDQFFIRDKIKVIYNAVDYSKYQPSSLSGYQWKEKLNLPQTKMIIFVGGVLKHKGGLILLDAFKKVLVDQPNTKLIVLGNTTSIYITTTSLFKRMIRKLFLKDNAKVFKKRMVELGLTNNVILPGPQTNVEEWLQASDVLVFPPTIDHFGRPIIEGISIGKAVVASDLPSNRELYQIFKESGMIQLFENKNSNDLAKKLNAALHIKSSERQKKFIDSQMKSNGFYAKDQALKINKVITSII